MKSKKIILIMLFLLLSIIFFAEGTGQQEFFENCDDITDWTITGGWSSFRNLCKDSTSNAQHNMTSSVIDLSASDILYANLTFYYNFDQGQVGDIFQVWVNSSTDDWTKVFSKSADSSGTTEINLSKYISLNKRVYIKGYCNLGALSLGSCIWDNINVTSYLDETAPAINLLEPVDFYNSSSYINIFVCNVSDMINIANVSLYANWSNIWHSVEINSSGVNNANYSFTVNIRNDYINQTNGINLAEIINGITMNDTHIFVLDSLGNSVDFYEIDTTNKLKVFDTDLCGGTGLVGLTTNGSDFWYIGNTFTHMCHVNYTGHNITEGFDIDTAGVISPSDITYNGSDFWILDTVNNFVFHLDNSGQNQTDGFSVTDYVGGIQGGITTNGSDFWIASVLHSFVFHLDKYGNNLTGGFSIPHTLMYYITNTKELSKGPSTDFWIYEGFFEIFIYHYASSGIGNYLWNCYACDILNNCGFAPANYTLTIDTTAPDLTVINPVNNSNYNINNVDLNFSVTDISLDIDTCWYELNNSGTNIIINNCNNITLTGLGNGNLNITVWANDTVNNVNQSDMIFFNINITFPTVLLTSPAQYFDFDISQTIITFSCYVSDDIGISNVSLYGNWSNVWHLVETNSSGLNNINYDFMINMQDYISQADGFSTAPAGIQYTRGITTNGSDFWVIDAFEKFVYHFNSSGNNQTDGFSVAGISFDITTNGSDFWIVDYSDKSVYHFNSSGDNQIDDFPTYSDKPLGITTNGSDFWIIDRDTSSLYHYNSSGNLMPDSIFLALIGLFEPIGVTTNGSDFWVSDKDHKSIYHINNSGSLIDIIDTDFNGSFMVSNKELDFGFPNSFWITNVTRYISPDTDNFVYHLASENAGTGTFFWYCSACDISGNCFSAEPYRFDILIQLWLKLTACPVTKALALILWLMAFIALFFIITGLISRIGFITFFGSILLIIMSWLVAVCQPIFAYTLASSGIMLLIYSVVTYWKN